MSEFTPEQLDAIRFRNQDACVVAGPGSGKTTVLVERYRSLVKDHGFDLSEILAITFTEKAAANMKAKIADQFRYDEVRLRELDRAWIFTIHGFCARLLRENAIAAGIDPRFTVLDARESDDLQFDCINAALDELVADRRVDALELIETLHVPRLAYDLKGAFDAIRSAGLTIQQIRDMPSPRTSALSAAQIAARIRANVESWPFKLSPTQREHKPELLQFANELAKADYLTFVELQRFLHKPVINLQKTPKDHKDELKAIREEDLKDLLTQALDRHVAPFRSLVFDVLDRFEALYSQRKVSMGRLDFNDLERRSIQLLRENPSVKDNIQKKFRQIMLDEFQDVNEQQNELVDLIRGRDNFFAVGDSNQSIYGFRHARPEIFRRYREQIEANHKHSGSLLSNFRSRPEILSCVQSLLNAADGIEDRPLRAAREFPEKPNPSIEIIRALDQEEDNEEEDDQSNREARWIAHRILELRQTPHDFRDFAVLCRNGESMKPILFEFDRAGIPYVCGRRQSFLVSREGLDIAALLHVVANPRDGVALGTVLRSPFVGVGDEAMLRARMLGSSVTSGLNILAFDPAQLKDFEPGDAVKLTRFLGNLKRWRADLQIVPLDVLISRTLSDCGFVWTPGSPVGDNVEAFLHLARKTGAGRSLLEFLRELESIEKGLSAESDLSDEDQGNCVQVMTAHAAKGLEFPITIIAALHQGTRQGSASVTFTPEHGLGIKWRDPLRKREGDRDSLKDSWSQANTSLVKAREEEEANRLLYVAMTRAEDHLILSYTRSKRPPTHWAKLVENFFADPATAARNGFAFSMTSADFDPPVISISREQAEPREVVVIPRPRISDQYDTAVNVTSLAVFAKCPRRYYLDRYLGWSPAAHGDDSSETHSEISAAELGSQVHEILAGKPGPHTSEAAQLAAVFQRSDLGRRAAGAPKSAREWDFIADIEGTFVRGSVDLWFEENGETHIVDYKTDATVRTAEYAPQLTLYALAIEKAFGRRPTTAWLHFLRPDVVEQVPLDATDARDLIRRLRNAQDTLTFDLNEGEHCRSCPFYRSMCPAGIT